MCATVCFRVVQCVAVCCSVFVRATVRTSFFQTAHSLHVWWELEALLQCVTVLQYVTVCCRALQRVAESPKGVGGTVVMRYHIAARYRALQCAAVWCTVSEGSAVWCSVSEGSWRHCCDTLTCDAVCCRALQCVAQSPKGVGGTVAVRYHVMQCVAESPKGSWRHCCSALPRDAVCCRALQRVAESPKGVGVTVAMRRRVMQCVVVWCSVSEGCWRHCCSTLPCVAVCCRALQCVAESPKGSWRHCCSTLPWVAVCCSVLQCVAGSPKGVRGTAAVRYRVMQCVAERCSVLQRLRRELEALLSDVASSS